MKLHPNTKFYTSEKGYYGYHYVDISTEYTLSKETEATPLHWVSGLGKAYQAFLVSAKILDSLTHRSCNVIWIKK